LRTRLPNRSASSSVCDAAITDPCGCRPRYHAGKTMLVYVLFAEPGGIYRPSAVDSRLVQLLPDAESAADGERPGQSRAENTQCTRSGSSGLASSPVIPKEASAARISAVLRSLTSLLTRMYVLVSGLPQARSSSVSAARTRAECGALLSRITAARVLMASLVKPRAISLTSAGILTRPMDCRTGPSDMVADWRDGGQWRSQI